MPLAKLVIWHHGKDLVCTEEDAGGVDVEAGEFVGLGHGDPLIMVFDHFSIINLLLILLIFQI